MSGAAARTGSLKDQQRKRQEAKRTKVSNKKQLTQKISQIQINFTGSWIGGIRVEQILIILKIR